MQSGPTRYSSSVLSWVLRSFDTLVPPLLLYLMTINHSMPWNRPHMLAAILASFLTLIVFQLLNIYRPLRGAGLLTEFRLLIGAWFLVAVMLLFIAWGTKSTAFFSRIVFGSWFLIVPLGMALFHAGARLFQSWLLKRSGNPRTAIIVGCGDLGLKLAAKIKSSNWLGLRLLGFFDDDSSKQGGRFEDLSVIGVTSDIEEYVKQKNVDHVYFALPMRAEQRMRDLFEALQDTTASVYFVPDLFVFELIGLNMQELGGLPLFTLCETPFFGPFGIVKRMEDVVLSILILAVIWPLMLVIALGVKIFSPGGPVFFKQHRYGLNGEQIRIYKFRTMTVREDGDQVVQAKRGDMRVTRFGAFLRRTSLDELPQFINVVQGRMSIVGPRPHPINLNEQYRRLIKGYMWRHKVRPGITGLAQVNGWRGETDVLEKMEKRVAYDLEYIRRWSILLDMKIIMMTVLAIFTGKNAH